MELLPTLVHRLRSVMEDSTGQHSVSAQYNTVRSQTLVLRKDLGLTTKAGALKENIKKNRYKDILPYDQTRVLLSLLTSASSHDYINASFIQGATPSRVYVATQGPLNTTLVDFWRMIWQYDVKVIVMACREIEMGKRKCECYWPPVHQSSSFGPFTICSQGETCPNEDMVVRTLCVTFQQASHTVYQYQFLSWPDHDIPSDTASVLDLLDRARDTQGRHTSPLLIHCSAGCGRTGVICALDYIHDLLVTKQIAADFSIMRVVLELRRQRPAAVQTKDQYHFIFSAVVCMFEKVLQSAGSQLYSNLMQVTQETNHDADPLKRPEQKTTTTPATPTTTKRSSQLTDMNDTYAVVNKPKQPHPPTTNPAQSPIATPRSKDGSRTTPSSHHYDNDPLGATASPVYSMVWPRPKPGHPSHSATPIYDTAGPTNPRLGEGPPLLGNSGGYPLITEHQLSTEDDYEYVSNPSKEMTNCSPGGMGFNCRIQKPRGPRDPPAEWSRLER